MLDFGSTQSASSPNTTFSAAETGIRSRDSWPFSANLLSETCQKSWMRSLLALQLPFMQVSETMGSHDSKIVDAASVD
jgi:hypothetical protein